MTLDEARKAIGLKAIYHPTMTGEAALRLHDAVYEVTPGGVEASLVFRVEPGAQAVEEGVITSVNDRFVFVRYGSDVGSKATPPEMLTLLSSAVSS